LNFFFIYLSSIHVVALTLSKKIRFLDGAQSSDKQFGKANQKICGEWQNAPQWQCCLAFFSLTITITRQNPYFGDHGCILCAIFFLSFGLRGGFHALINDTSMLQENLDKPLHEQYSDN
jgi:hypothetical protein